MGGRGSQKYEVRKTKDWSWLQEVSTARLRRYVQYVDRTPQSRRTMGQWALKDRATSEIAIREHAELTAHAAAGKGWAQRKLADQDARMRADFKRHQKFWDGVNAISRQLAADPVLRAKFTAGVFSDAELRAAVDKGHL